MPRGRKKGTLKKECSTKSKIKNKKDTSKEVRDMFFNTVIPEEDDAVVDAEVDEAELLKPPLEDEEIVKEIEAPETLVDQTVEDNETFVTISSINDDGDEVKNVFSVRANAPPKASWADKKVKFTCGQFIMPAKISKDSIKNYECAVVICPDVREDTYMIKLSRSMNETAIKGSEWILADKNCKPYVKYWDSISPMIRINK